MARFDNYLNARLIYRRDVSDDLMILKLRPEQEIPFFPGQFCTLAIDDVAKPYSLVSSPHEDALELFIERVPEGALTRRLWQLKVGDTVKIMPRAKGRFFFEESFKRQLMVSTVAGVAPFLSMIRFKLQEGMLSSYRIVLWQGAAYQNEFGYFDELSELDRRGLLSYVPTISRPREALNQGWRGGREKAHVLFKHYLETLPRSPQDTIVYACGHPGMIQEVATAARCYGCPFKEEKYFVLRVAPNPPDY